MTTALTAFDITSYPDLTTTPLTFTSEGSWEWAIYAAETDWDTYVA